MKKDMTQEEIDEVRRRLRFTNEIQDAEIVGTVYDTLLLRRIRLYLGCKRLLAALIGPTEPVIFPQVNGTLHGNRDTRELPVCRTVENNTVSCWEIPLWKRVKLLWSGRVYLVVKGPTHPPLWIDTEIGWK